VVFGFKQGTLENGWYAHFRWTVQDFSSENFVQTNDYSFNATLTDSNGSEWSNVVLRESSTIIWGVDP
jgi:hypothetical protein